MSAFSVIPLFYNYFGVGVTIGIGVGRHYNPFDSDSDPDPDKDLDSKESVDQHPASSIGLMTFFPSNPVKQFQENPAVFSECGFPHTHNLEKLIRSGRQRPCHFT